MTNSYENNRIKELKVFLSSHFELFDSLNIYFWISGGSILSFFAGQKPSDIDIYFPTKKMADQAVGLLKKKGFGVEHCWENNRVLKSSEQTYDIIHEFNNPNQIFENFDYTICMSYLDCKGKWKCHPDYFTHLNSRKIVRNKRCIENRSKIKKLHAITEIKRLLKIINRGFTIDSDNLKIFLQDTRDIILSEYEYIEKIKNLN